ncbi:MAG: response regulator [Candidatus Omnitrophota bacterium]|jgi:two-component system alkaline phosphatase synthesis response regulator PhoP|nr:response regulator [Candidatus Omnitrophota bacterium]MDD5137340.1 response regulator [Candidatus Omnitrophota bacterium]MDD5538245.1 response regulator [Candidatus Omnitrophota bacterium]
MDRQKLLIVDDEPDVLKLLGERLTKAGYDVIKASSGKEAIAMAQNKMPDLIILDIAMPGMDGSEVASILRTDAKTKDIPILFLTCLFTKQEEKACGHLLGQNFFIAKPYDVNELLDEIGKRVIRPENHS